VPVAIIACDINSGRKIIFSNQDIGPDGDDTLVIRDALFSEAVRSSISIPITFEPRQLMNMSMVDGGLKDIVPVLVNRSMGADYVVGVNLGQKIYDSPAQGLRQIISRTLSIMTYETSDTEEKIFADMLVFPGVPDTGLDDIKEVPG
jgi:NTE family protein